MLHNRKSSLNHTMCMSANPKHSPILSRKKASSAEAIFHSISLPSLAFYFLGFVVPMNFIEISYERVICLVSGLFGDRYVTNGKKRKKEIDDN
jgi:hypothetical protein